MEIVLAKAFPRATPSKNQCVWVGNSIPIGAGMPDILLACYNPNALSHAAGLPRNGAAILGLLRSRGPLLAAELAHNMSARTRESQRHINDTIDFLLSCGAIEVSLGKFKISSLWSNVLPEVITIEAKIGNWPKAARQAARNRLFSHFSYVALPRQLAKHAVESQNSAWDKIGIIAVDVDRNIEILRPARRSKPQIWSYYYQLAAVIARNP